MSVTVYRGMLAIEGALRRGWVEVRDGRIAAVESGRKKPPRDADRVVDAAFVTAGLVDLQVNGAFGLAVESGAAAVNGIAARLTSTGVASWLPTLVSSPPDVYRAAIAGFRQVAAAGVGARALGLHLEGPFLSPARAGAHERAAIAGADARLLDELIASGALRLMTLAPELDGAGERIRRLVAGGVTVSVGHTDATYEDVVRAADAGATMVTHLFNAMSPFQHRAPGAVGAALDDDRLTVGLILDEVHCHAAAARLALKAKGASRIALVTDAMAGAGVGPGRYTLGGKTVIVDDRSARLEDGTLAGSILTLDAAVRNAMRVLGVDFATAVSMASEVPARLLRLPGKGVLAPGADAELTLWSEDHRVVDVVLETPRVGRE